MIAIGRRSAPPWLAPSLIAVAFCFGAIRLFAYANRYAVDVFYLDEWDYFSGIFDGASAWRLFAWQHGPPRLGAGLLLMRAILFRTDWSSRALAFSAVAIYLLAALCALWLKRRVTGRLSIFDAIIPLLFLQVAHYETWIGAIDLSHGPLPLLMAVGFALALTLENDWLRASIAALIACVATYTGFGLFIAFVALVVFALLAWRGRAAPYLLAFVATLTCVGSFFIGYRFAPAVDCFVFPAPHPADYLRFLGIFLGHPLGWESLAGVRQWLAIGVALLAMAFTLLALVLSARRSDARPLWLVVFSLTGFAILFGANAAVGRVCLGAATAVGSRYVPYGISGCFAVYLALHAVQEPRWLRGTALFIFLACTLPLLGVGHNRGGLRWTSEVKQRWRDCYLRTHDLARCQSESAWPIYPDAAATRLQQKLDFLEQRRLNLFRR